MQLGSQPTTGIALLYKRKKPPDIEDCIGACLLRQTLRNHWTSATLALCEGDLVARSFEQPRCCFSDLGIIEVNESIVKENNLSGGPRCVPGCGRFLNHDSNVCRCYRWKPATGVDSQVSIQNTPNDGQGHDGIRQRWPG